MASHGRVGCIVPTGIATADTTKLFFQNLMESSSIVSLIGLSEIRDWFPATDNPDPFCLLTLQGSDGRVGAAARFAFDIKDATELHDESRRFALTAGDISVLNPNTRTCPIFRSGLDAVLTKHLYQNVPVMIREGENPTNAWNISFLSMLHMANDSEIFRHI